jgi:hypothetical protein
MTSKELIEKFPLIFQVRKGRELEPFAMFGIECRSGWLPLLNTLCYQIQSYIDYRKEANERIEQNKKKYSNYDQTPYELIPQVVVTQVKEKYGTLRFYYDGGDETIDGMVRMAEAMSAITCEVCGDLGKMRGRHWLYTACDEHTRPEDKKSEIDESLL